MSLTSLSEKSKAGTADESLKSGKRVLETEAAALAEMARTLDGAFHQAIELISAAEGRVIVTGMGKSGHVGKKIAATFASTGTPSFFVHPGEASHGDMGMIVRGDVVLALSNSGEAKELQDVIAYAKRFAIPLIAITSRAASTLGSKADVTLLLPDAPEACPNGLAPTTSTTLTLAMGDALAVTLLERKGFSASDFKIFHPGGKLGQQLLKVSEIMHKGASLPVAAETVKISEAIKIINDRKFGCIALTDPSGVLSGIITDGDIRRHIGDGLLEKTAAAVMSKTPKTATATMLVGEAMAIMNGLKTGGNLITALIVVDDARKPIGLLHMHDCLRAGFA